MAQTFDTIVIGAGLVGLALTRELTRQGQKVLLLEAGNQAGALHHEVDWGGKRVDNGLRLFTHHESLQKFFSDLNLISEAAPALPIFTFHAHEQKEFLGFGSHQPAAYDQLNYFIRASQNRIDIPAHTVIASLKEQIPASSILLKSPVTSLQTENHTVTGVVVNHSEKYQAKKVILTASPSALLELLPQDVLPIRVRQKLSKFKTWSCLCLDYMIPSDSAPPSQHESAAYLLQTVQSEDPIVLFGQKTQNLWQWILFFSEEEAEDADALGALVKKAKRQMRRAFPHFFDTKPLERVCVFENVGVQTHVDFPMEPVEGLILASPLLSAEVNFDAAFDWINRVAQSQSSVLENEARS